MDVVLEALVRLVSGWHLFYLVLGVYLGLVLGVLPGLGGTVGLAILLPFVFGMDPGYALAMMIGLQSVTTTSDTFPAVLMGIPGTAAAQATVVDGFPMAKKGEGARALGAAFSASLIGGVFGALLLTGALFAALPILRLMGFGEQMMLVIVALSMIGVLTGDSALKGLAACCLGLMIGTIGSAPATGSQRLTFDMTYLIDGVPLIIVGLAMFALPEIVDLLRTQRTIAEGGKLGKGWIQGLRDTLSHWKLVLRCSTLGSVLGALPGLGGSVIDWIAYSHVVQTTRDKTGFGKGDVRGVIAPESANNAKEGGALIPTLLLGIPGSGSMAILLAGFIMVGVRPGVEMVTTNLDLTYIIIWSIALANIIGAGTCLLFARPVALLTTVPYTIIAPIMFALIFFAAFQPTRDWGDLITLMLLGSIGIYMKRFGWPRPALLIGFVLAEGLESGIYRTSQVYGWSFLERPIVIILILVTVVSVYTAIRFKPQRAALDDDGAHAARDRGPQIAFFLLIAAFAVYMAIESFGWNYATGLFPRAISLVMLALLVPIGIALFTARGPNVILHDADRGKGGGDVEHRSNEHYILWLLGMLAAAAVFGFVAAIFGFIYAFLRIKARLSHIGCATGAGGTLALFLFIAHILNLEYPQGVLSPYLPGLLG